MMLPDDKWPLRTFLLVWLAFFLLTLAIDAALIALVFWLCGVSL